jgi:hypothetical protein
MCLHPTTSLTTLQAGPRSEDKVLILGCLQEIPQHTIALVSHRTIEACKRVLSLQCKWDNAIISLDSAFKNTPYHYISMQSLHADAKVNRLLLYTTPPTLACWLGLW